MGQIKFVEDGLEKFLFRSFLNTNFVPYASIGMHE